MEIPFFFPLTLWLFHIAMENGPFIDDCPSYKPPFINLWSGFSMAMLVIARGYIPKFDDKNLCRSGCRCSACGAAGSGRTAGDDAREDGSDQEPHRRHVGNWMELARGSGLSLPRIKITAL